MTCRLLAAATVLMTAAAMPTQAGQVVEIQLRGHYYAEPATVQMIIAVEPDGQNRSLRIEADGDRLFRSTEVTLNGDAERRLHIVEFKNLPAGNYELRAEVHSSDGVRGMDLQDLVVAGR